MNNHSLVSIDFWNTLVVAATGGDERHRVRIEALREVAGRYRGELADHEFQAAKQEASKRFDQVWLGEQRTPTTLELVQNVVNYLNLPVSQDETAYLVQAFEESLWDGPPRLVDEVEAILPELASRYRLALISDTMYSPGRVLRQYLDNHGLLDYFDAFVFSDEVGYSKPNPQAFHSVLRSTECVAERSFHVGDLQPTDIKGAQSVGMKAILYTGVTAGQDKETTADYVLGSWDEIGGLLL